MNNNLKYFCFIMVCVLCAGCQVFSIARLHNHIGEDIVIKTYSPVSETTYSEITNGTIKIKSPYLINNTVVVSGNYTYNHELEYLFTAKNGQFADFESAYKFSVKSEHYFWSYDGKWIPDNYFKSPNSNTRLVDLQIEPDGAIYVLSSNMQAPVTNFPAQPPGFPLHPN